jgi:hypothetical protein
MTAPVACATSVISDSPSITTAFARKGARGKLSIRAPLHEEGRITAIIFTPRASTAIEKKVSYHRGLRALGTGSVARHFLTHGERKRNGRMQQRTESPLEFSAPWLEVRCSQF